MAAILLVLAIVPVWCHIVLARTRISIDGQTITNFDINGKVLGKITIEGSTVASLNRKQNILEIKNEQSIIVVNNIMDNWKTLLEEIAKRTPINNNET